MTKAPVSPPARACDGKPFEDLEAVLAAIGHTLVAKEQKEYAGVFAAAQINLEYFEHDNWDGGTSVWHLCIGIPSPKFISYSDDQKASFESLVNEILAPFLPEYGHWVRAKLTPLPLQDRNWRQNVSLAVSGEAITNQGRARSDNVAPIMFDGLRFRSEPEVLLYKALKQTGIPFAPLPVFVRGGRQFSRIEPDFVLIKDGIVLFTEIDGGAFHRESPADAHYRLKPFQDEGVIVERVKSEHCDTPEKAQRFAAHLVQLIEKRRRQA